MAYIDEGTINAIRRKHPIKDIVERYVTLTKKGNDYWGLCPFHADNNASMSVSTKLDMFQCFACHKAGNIFNFISDIENISYGEAIRLLAREDGYEVYGVKNTDANLGYYEIFKIANKFYQNNLNSKLGHNAIDYLTKRSINRDVISKFELGLSIARQPITPFLLNKYDINKLIDVGISNTESNDVFVDRIMIPIHDLHGNPIGYGARIYQTRDDSKYINTKATKIFDKSKILYNYHRAHEQLKKNDAIVIMEGYFDVIRASTAGVNNCVAPMGTSLTNEQVNILKKITNTVILCFDGDEAGERATIRAIPLLEDAKLNVKIVRLEEKDPDEFIIKRGCDAFINKINNPLSVIDFKMNILKENKNLTDAKDISAYLDQVIKEIVKEKDEFVVEVNLKKLATRFDIEYEIIKKRYNKYRELENKKSKINEELIIKKDKKIFDLYGQATNNLLYYMIKSADVINHAEENVIMILDDKKRMLFNEIIYYYHKYGKLIIADFITYLVTSTKVFDTFSEIINMNLKSDYTDEEINDYINVVNDYVKEDKIKKLEFELKSETDPMKQASISMKIMEIKKGVNVK